MQIIISKRETSDSIAEWFLIELQGTVETPNGVTLAGSLVGDLHFTHKGDPIIIIGHHVLYGKETKLDKPFAVLKKIFTDEELSYECTALIKRKLLFKTRPKPLVFAKKI